VTAATRVAEYMFDQGGSRGSSNRRASENGLKVNFTSCNSRQRRN
jgi:hypothetical protein